MTRKSAFSTTMRRRFSTPLIGILALGAPVHAMAQPADAAENADADEIVVVAKRAQNIRDVAGTINIVNAESLTKVGARDAEDIFKLTPGVQFNKGSADGSLLTIRGVGTSTSSDNTSVGQLPTGIYIEDVPFTDPFQYISTPDISAFDLEAVEVLRGPQGALYGSGSLGGAVNYRFRKPELDAVGGSLMVNGDAAQGGNAKGSAYAALNLPVADTLAFRFVGQYQQDPGYQDNIGTGRKNVNDRTVKGARAMALFKPDDHLTIDALYLYQRSDQDDISSSVAPNVRFTNSLRPSAFVSSFELAKLEASYEFDHVKITSLTAHHKKRRDQNGDITRLVVPDVTVGIDVPSEDVLGIGPFPQVVEGRNIEDRSSKGFSQELRIASAKGGRFNWLFGGFGQNVDFNRGQDVFLVNANDPVYGDLYFNVRRDGKAKERALFGEATLDFGPLEIGAGGRYFHTSVRFTQIRQAALAASAMNRTFSFSESGFTPKFNLRYKFDGNTVVYANAAKGFRFGGINSAPGSAEYKSDNLWNYELGVRLQPASSLNIDLSGFYIDWKDPQVGSADQNGFLIISNVAKAVSKGAELSIRWNPGQGFGFTGSAAYTDAKTKATFQSTRNFGTDVAGGFTGNFDVPSGTRLPGTPKFQATAQPTYLLSGPWDTDVTIAGTLAYTGKRRAQIDADLTLPAYTTVDIRTTLSKGPWQMALAVSNLFNEKGIAQAAYSYYSTGTGTDGYGDYYLIRPRVYSLSMRYNF